MATSGTVSTTTIDTAQLIEHAMRRCGVPVAKQTPEIVQMAQDNLYLYLLSLANEGINLWCVETDYIGLYSAQATYAMPAGTIDVLNLLYSQPQIVTGTNTTTGTSTTTDLSSATIVTRVGLMFSSISASDTIVVAYSSDNISFTTAATYTSSSLAVNTWYWLNFATQGDARYWKVSTTSASVASSFELATLVSDLPIIQMNRDQYQNLPNKAQQARPCVNYYLEKLLSPQVTLWPVPNNNTDHLTLTRHRQVQDVGSLSQQIEVPQRRIESVTWSLAERLAFELPSELIDPNRRQEVVAMSAKYGDIADIGETDNASSRIQPRITGYTR